jgi:acetoacetate decarboxylase
MKKLTKKQIGALEAIRNSKGRFFGLYTTQGQVMNAQFLGESDDYIHVYDRNRNVDRKLAKSSIDRVNIVA